MRPVVKQTIPHRNVTLELTQPLHRLPGIDDRKDRLRSIEEKLSFSTINTHQTKRRVAMKRNYHSWKLLCYMQDSCKNLAKHKCRILWTPKKQLWQACWNFSAETPSVFHQVQKKLKLLKNISSFHQKIYFLKWSPVHVECSFTNRANFSLKCAKKINEQLLQKEVPNKFRLHNRNALLIDQIIGNDTWWI